VNARAVVIPATLHGPVARPRTGDGVYEVEFAFVWRTLRRLGHKMGLWRNKVVIDHVTITLVACLAACSGGKQHVWLGEETSLNGGNTGQKGTVVPAGGSPGGGIGTDGGAGSDAGALPTTLTATCISEPLPALVGVDALMFKEWLTIPEMGTVLRGVVGIDSLFLLSSTRIAHLDLEGASYCVLAGLPNGWSNRDLHVLPSGRLLLSSAPPNAPAAIYHSDNNGITWTLSSFPWIPADSQGPSHFATDAVSGYVYTTEMGEAVGRSADQGSTWTRLGASGGSDGAIAIDRTGAVLVVAVSGLGGCRLRFKELTSDAGDWLDAPIAFSLPCNGVVADPTSDRTFYVFGAARVTHIAIGQDGHVTEAGGFGDATIVVNDLWADRVTSGRIWFTGVSSEGLATYESVDFGQTATRRPVEGNPSVIGSVVVELPKNRGLAVWSFAPSTAGVNRATGFVSVQASLQR